MGKISIPFRNGYIPFFLVRTWFAIILLVRVSSFKRCQSYCTVSFCYTKVFAPKNYWVSRTLSRSATQLEHNEQITTAAAKHSDDNKDEKRGPHIIQMTVETRTLHTPTNDM